MSVHTLRILVLHGFGQSVQIIQHQTGALRRALRKHNVVFDYMNAPHELQEICEMRPGQLKIVEETGMETVDRYSWWYGDTTGSLSHYHGFTESVQCIRQQWSQCATEHNCNGYDGLLGFSQGACLATILASIKHCAANNTLQQRINNTQYQDVLSDVKFLHSLRFCIIVSGFITHDVDLQRLYGSIDEPIQLQLLHVIGSSDAQVDPTRSHQCSKCFAAARVIEHDGGHYFPMKQQYLNQYVHFIESQTQTVTSTDTDHTIAHKL